MASLYGSPPVWPSLLPSLLLSCKSRSQYCSIISISHRPHPLALTAANEVDDLQTIVILQLRFRPAVAAHDLAVQLYGDPILLQIERANQVAQRGRRRYLPALAVDDDCHCRHFVYPIA